MKRITSTNHPLWGSATCLPAGGVGLMPARADPPGQVFGFGSGPSTGRTLCLLALGSVCIALGGCSSDDDGAGSGAASVMDPSADPVEPLAAGDPVFELQILHASDMDGATGALNNVEQFSALVDAFRAELPDTTITLSAGDNYIPGPRYFAASGEDLTELLGIPGDGRADMIFQNAMGFQASAVGNHELDQGTEAFAGIIAPESAEEGTAGYPGAAFPYLSSNLDFSTDEALAPLVADDAQAAASIAGRLAASTTLEVGGETIGIVGATTPTLAALTSAGGITVSPGPQADVDELAATIQPAVDALLDTGIDKIILLAHMQQISVEQALATRLRGVDVIIAGGSNALLADDNDTLRDGDTALDNYPLAYTAANGEPLLLVNTAGDYEYLGRLVVDFDENGLLVTDTLDDTRNGVWAAIEAVVNEQDATPNGDVVAVSTALRDVLAERDGNIVGKTAVYLDGRRAQVRSQETNLGNLTADANLWLAQQADPATVVSLKNGGGIRSEIGLAIQPPGTTDPADIEFSPPVANEAVGKQEGDISEFDLQGSLRFNNGLALLTLTAAELKEVLEHAVAEAGPEATPGQFPQVAGLQFSFDPTLPGRVGSDTLGDVTEPGQRIRNLAIVDAEGTIMDRVVEGGAVAGDPERTIRVVILDFIAACVGSEDEECGDGYPLKGLSAPDLQVIASLGTDPGAASFADPGSEQDALAEYLSAFFVSEPFDVGETPAAEDLRIQNLSEREDAVFGE